MDSKKQNNFIQDERIAAQQAAAQFTQAAGQPAAQAANKIPAQVSAIKQNSYAPPTRPNYTNEHVRGAGSAWISVLRIFAWVAFLGVLGCGAVMGYRLWESGMWSGVIRIVMVAGVALGAIIVAFAAVSVIMVYLNMAKDISVVRVLVENEKKMR